MSLPADVVSVTHSVQLAVAPVFFLTAVAGMISAVAGRLARIIDRARVLDACRAAPEGAIIVVHGTDTMVDTARVIAGAGR